MMLLSDVKKSYSDISYHNEDLKSLTRYRFSKVEERAKLKTSFSRLAQILFPELEKLVPTLHMTSIYQLLEEFPSASAIASVHLTRLTNLLSKASKVTMTVKLLLRLEMLPKILSALICQLNLLS